MPWYATKDVSGAWGWHWTMHFDPEQKRWDDQRKIASHDYPLIGPYDSGDDHAMECQALSDEDRRARWRRDRLVWHKRPQRPRDESSQHAEVHSLAQKAGLNFAVCYEDQAVKSLKNGEDMKQAEKDLHWAKSTFSPIRAM